jgi:hypothetical protein
MPTPRPQASLRWSARPPVCGRLWPTGHGLMARVRPPVTDRAVPHPHVRGCIVL